MKKDIPGLISLLAVFALSVIYVIYLLSLAFQIPISGTLDRIAILVVGILAVSLICGYFKREQ